MTKIKSRNVFMLEMQGLEWLLEYSLLHLYPLSYETVRLCDCKDLGELQIKFYESMQNMKVLVYIDVKRASVDDDW